MKTQDRAEALRRVPAYQADLKKWRQLAERVKKHNRKTVDKDVAALKAHEVWIKRRWKANPPTYDGWKERFPVTLFDLVFGVNVIHPNSHKHSLISEMVEGYDPFGYAIWTDTKGTKPLTKSSHTGGKHLCLIVDLTRTKKLLVGEFERAIKDYQKMFSKKRRDRKGAFKPGEKWEIYDRVCAGEKLKKIAAERFNNGRPLLFDVNKASYERDKASYEKVWREKEKAQEMIKQVSKLR